MHVLLAVVMASATVVAPDGVVPERTELVARLARNVATTARPLGPDRIAEVTRKGGEWTATLEAAVVDQHGRVRLPAGAVVSGHVVRAEPGFGLARGKLELAVDRIERRPVRARLVGLDVQQIVSTDPGTHVESVAFWGALMGGVAFGIPGVAIGYGAGGLSAGFNAASQRRTDGWLSAGTLLTLELEAPLVLAPCVATRAGPSRC